MQASALFRVAGRQACLPPSPPHRKLCSKLAFLSTPRRSILKSQQPLAADGTPLLGRAQRVPSPTKVPHSTTKELRSLMSALSLEEEDGGAGAQAAMLGTLPMLSPVRAQGHLRAQLGVDKVRALPWLALTFKF